MATGPVNAFTALGGSLIGGIAGSTVEHATSDTDAYEYIVRKPNADLVSVTQKDQTPLALGQKVLVIAGNQARVVPDYTVSLPATAEKPPEIPKRDTASLPESPTPPTPAPPVASGPNQSGDDKSSAIQSAATSASAEGTHALP